MTGKPRNCPIPECRNGIGRQEFFCKKHVKLLPPVIGAAVKRSFLEWQRLEPGTPERAVVAVTLKQALAFGYASICEQLKLEVPGVQAAAKVLTAAIMRELH
jgi:hypothetical protein